MRLSTAISTSSSDSKATRVRCSCTSLCSLYSRSTQCGLDTSVCIDCPVEASVWPISPLGRNSTQARSSSMGHMDDAFGEASSLTFFASFLVGSAGRVALTWFVPTTRQRSSWSGTRQEEGSQPTHMSETTQTTSPAAGERSASADNFAALFEQSIADGDFGGEGEIIIGTVVSVGRDHVVVDIGGKSEGV